MAALKGKWTNEPYLGYEKSYYEKENDKIYVMLVAPIDTDTKEVLIDNSSFYFYAPSRSGKVLFFKFSYEQKNKEQKAFLNPKFSDGDAISRGRFTGNKSSATEMIIAAVELLDISCK
jgi:hypothetical protein